MNSNLEKRVSKLERVNDLGFMVRFPDEGSKPGKETYFDTLKPDGCPCCIDMSWADMGNL